MVPDGGRYVEGSATLASLLPGSVSHAVGSVQGELAVGDRERLDGEGLRRRALDDRAVGDRVAAAVTGAVGRAVGNVADRAVHVRADGAERLELPRRRLRDDRRVVRVDL